MISPTTELYSRRCLSTRVKAIQLVGGSSSRIREPAFYPRHPNHSGPCATLSPQVSPPFSRRVSGWIGEICLFQLPRHATLHWFRRPPLACDSNLPDATATTTTALSLQLLGPCLNLHDPGISSSIHAMNGSLLFGMASIRVVRLGRLPPRGNGPPPCLHSSL